MNEIIRSIKQRKSCRVFLDKAVAPEVKAEIIDAALQAPSAGNQLLYSIIDITDQKIKDELSVLCDTQKFIATAPMVFIFLADCRRWYDSYEYARMGCEIRKPSDADLMLSCSDAVIAAQNTVVAAEALGLNSCYIGDVMENAERVSELLNLDKYTVPVCMLVYGYPEPSQQNRKKPERFDKKYIVFENGYRRLTEEEHREMFRDRAERTSPAAFDYDAYIDKFYKRKYVSEYALEMERSGKIYMDKFHG